MKVEGITESRTNEKDFFLLKKKRIRSKVWEKKKKDQN